MGSDHIKKTTCASCKNIIAISPQAKSPYTKEPDAGATPAIRQKESQFRSVQPFFLR